MRLSGEASPPDRGAAGPGGVVVGWRRAITFFSFVVTVQEDLDNGGDYEKEHVEDRDGEAGCFEFAGSVEVRCVCDILVTTESEAICTVARCFAVCGPGTERGVDIATAATSSTSSHDGDRYEAADEANVQEHCDKCEKSDPTQAQG